MKNLILFLCLLAFQASGTADPKIHKWSIQAPDDQIFILEKHFEKPEPTYFVSFHRGTRNIKTLPMLKRHWLELQKDFTDLTTQTRLGKNCTHNLVLKIETDKAKEKIVCLAKLTEKEKGKIKKLTVDLREYLYGP
jgi:hypothetical protein